LKTVKIIKSSRDLYWYHNKIGQYFNVTEIDINTLYEYDHTTGESKLKRYYKYTVLDENGNKTLKTIDNRDCKVMTLSDKINKIKERL